MSFFMRRPKVWIAIWSIFGVGGLVITLEAIAAGPFDAAGLAKGIIGIAVALIMIGYITRNLRAKNA